MQGASSSSVIRIEDEEDDKHDNAEYDDYLYGWSLTFVTSML